MLKIDRYFISNNERFKTGFSHCRSYYQYGKTLDLEVVAEGIESQEVLNELLILGCTTGQDYFWNKPMNQDAFVQHL